MAKVKKAQFGTSKSDSLMKESNRKKAFARTQEEIGNSQKKYIGKPIDSLLKSPGWGGINKKLGKDSRYAVSEGKLVTYPGTLSPEERLEIARKAKESAKKDSIESVKSKKMKSGGKQMIKRADGSYSQRGLWDNIRANKGSGKKPTAQMLKQERKIKAASKKK
jgi:hypothetical protein